MCDGGCKHCFLNRSRKVAGGVIPWFLLQSAFISFMEEMVREFA